MSIEVIRNQIEAFISSPTAEVMAIKGDWGVGKTYTWKKYLKNAKDSGHVGMERYSYVSLFGINSLDAFKYSIFENVVSKDLIGTEASIETFKENTSGIIESFGRKAINLFKGGPFLKGFSPAIESLSFLSLNKTIICIDDLERKGSKLDIKDVLGLVSLLKEQKNCKVVLLLNDGEDGLDDYVKYREKVIDIELKFDPTSDECTDIAYDGSGYHDDLLKEFTNKLGIRNIRVLKKIERLVNLSQQLTSDFEDEIKYQVVHSIALFSWCYYCSSSDEEVPPLSFVTKSGYSLFGIGDEKDEEEKEKKWKARIREYGYQLTDELDLLLAEAVRTGFFVERTFNIEASKKNGEILSAKSEGSFSDAWSLYHDSFDNNEEAVINGLYESFKKNFKHISLTNLNGTVTLFRELGEDDKATEIIDLYIKERRDETGLFNLKQNNFFGDVRDPEIVEKFDKVYEESVTEETASQVLERIAGKNGFNQSDEIVLANTTSDEFYDIFKNIEGKHLSSYVGASLQFGNFSNATDRQKEISSNAIEALKKIAGESEINRRRVRKFGIDV